MKLVFIYATSQDAAPGTEWRFIHIAHAMKRSGVHIIHNICLESLLQGVEPYENICLDADLIIMQAIFSQTSLPVIQHLKAQGKIVLLDLEDRSNFNWTILDESKGYHPFREAVEEIETALRIADGGILPFASSLARWNGYTRYHVIPSYIDLENLMSIKQVEHEEIVVGWHQGLVRNQPEALVWLEKFLLRVCELRPNVRFLPLAVKESELRDWPIAISKRFLPPEISNQPWPNPLGWVDIGLVPIFDCSTESLSRINTLEYMALKIPWIGSEMGSNFDLRSHGWLVDNTYGSWERILLDMIDHFHIYQRDSVWGPYVYGISQGVEENLDRIIRTFLQIIESAEAEREAGYGKAYFGR